MAHFWPLSRERYRIGPSRGTVKFLYDMRTDNGASIPSSAFSLIEVLPRDASSVITIGPLDVSRMIDSSRLTDRFNRDMIAPASSEAS